MLGMFSGPFLYFFALISERYLEIRVLVKGVDRPKDINRERKYPQGGK